MVIPSTLTVWMEGDEGRIEERGGEDGRNIPKISTFNKPISIKEYFKTN